MTHKLAHKDLTIISKVCMNNITYSCCILCYLIVDVNYPETVMQMLCTMW